jgi:Cu+-exporting ATPase
MSNSEKSENKTTDPVCGMSIDPAKAAASSPHGGKTYFFCSDSCKQKFDNSPDQYLHTK